MYSLKMVDRNNDSNDPSTQFNPPSLLPSLKKSHMNNSSNLSSVVKDSQTLLVTFLKKSNELSLYIDLLLFLIFTI